MFLGTQVKLIFIQIGLLLFFITGLTAIFYDQKVRLLSLSGKWVLCIYIFFLLNGFVQNIFSDGFHAKYLPNLSWDIGFYLIGIACLSFVGVTNRDLKRLVAIYIVSCILILIVTVPYMNSAVVLLSERRKEAFIQVGEGFESRNLIYITQRMLGSLAILFFALSMTFIRKRRYILFSLIPVGMALYFGLYYQKRDTFVQMAFFIFVFYFLPSIKFSFNRTMYKMFGIIGIFVSLLIAYQQPLIRTATNNVIDRFTIYSENRQVYDRASETEYMLNQFPSYYYILGRGHSSFFEGNSFQKGNNNLHLGMGNFILKGGYLMLLSYTALLLINTIRGARYLFMNNERLMFWLSAYCLISIYTFVAYWGWYPNIIYLPLALFSFDIIRNYERRIG